MQGRNESGLDLVVSGQVVGQVLKAAPIRFVDLYKIEIERKKIHFIVIASVSVNTLCCLER